jgi:hypothetical protein
MVRIISSANRYACMWLLILSGKDRHRHHHVTNARPWRSVAGSMHMYWVLQGVFARRAVDSHQIRSLGYHLVIVVRTGVSCLRSALALWLRW